MVVLRRALTDWSLGARTLNLEKLEGFGLTNADVARICELLEKSGLATTTDTTTGAHMQKALAQADGMKVAEHVEEFLTDRNISIDVTALRAFTRDADDAMTWSKFWAELSRLGVPEDLRTPLFDHLRKQYLRRESDSQKIDSKWIRINGNGHHDQSTPAFPDITTPPIAQPVAPQPPPQATVNVSRRLNWPARPQMPAWTRNIRRLQMPNIKRPQVPPIIAGFPTMAVKALRTAWAKPAVKKGLLVTVAVFLGLLLAAYVIRATRPFVTAAAQSAYHFAVNPYTLLLALLFAGTVLLVSFLTRVGKVWAERKLSKVSRKHDPGPVAFVAVLLVVVAIGLVAWREYYSFQYHRLLVLAHMAAQEDLTEHALFDQQQQTLNQADALLGQATKDRQTAANDKTTAQLQQTAAISGNKEITDKLAETTKLRTEEQRIRDEIRSLRQQIADAQANQQKQVQIADQQLAEAKTSLESARKELETARTQLQTQKVVVVPPAPPPPIVVNVPPPKVVVAPAAAAPKVVIIQPKPRVVVKKEENPKAKVTYAEVPFPPRPPKGQQ
ncbi:MAG TPA: hypothetical protein VGQ87_03565 [Patescibacteria group bacterium]|nr:hypothetical protein [Patescibacteria group bacterium]